MTMPKELSLPTLNRRSLLQGAAALAAAGSLAGISPARAAGQVVVGTWGGDFAKGLGQSIDVQMEALGYKVVQDANTTAARNGKVIAEQALPTGSFDVVCVQPGAAETMANAGLLEKLDPAKIPNLAKVLPNLRISEYMAPHIFSPTVLIYNPDTLPEPPKSLGDLLDPKYAGKFAVTDANYTIVVMAAALYAAGDIHAIDKGKAVVEKLNANGLKFFSADMMAAPLQTGEITVGLLPLARVVMWQNQGMNIKAAFPQEGSIPYIDGMSVPKNAPNKEGAYKYIDVMLGAEAQRIFAEFMGYLPSIDDAGLTGKTAEQLTLPSPAPKIVLEDYAFTATVQQELGEWWKKSILGK